CPSYNAIHFLLLFNLLLPRPPNPPLFPYTTLFRSPRPAPPTTPAPARSSSARSPSSPACTAASSTPPRNPPPTSSTSSSTRACRGRKSTRLNSSHDQISYAVFCLKKKSKMPNYLVH